MIVRRLPPLLLALPALAALAACEGHSGRGDRADGDPALRLPEGAANVREACNGLAGTTIPAQAIGLPSSGARIATAGLQLAVRGKVNASGAPVPDTPEYCKVIGSILPVDPSAPPIRFQVNLPTEWNRRAIQFGGGGFNGTLIDGVMPAPSAPPDAPLPLARGTLTFGTDGGHQAVPGEPLQGFAANAEALENFAYGAYKKARDVAVELARRRYGLAPRRIYYVGSGEGGREGLAMAQRFPQDYDGVFARVPSIGLVGQQIAGLRNGLALMNDGWLNALKVQQVHRAVLEACDRLDGLADGIVGRAASCARRFDPAVLRCPQGGDTGAGCLSDRQLDALRMLHLPATLGVPLAHGDERTPGWGWGGEQDPSGYAQWWSGKVPPSVPPTLEMGWQWVFGYGTVRQMIAPGLGEDPRVFEPRNHAARILALSRMLDATDPDLGRFIGRGGRLLLLEFGADYARSPQLSVDYLKAMETTMGRAAVERGARLYVTAGAGHDGVGVPSEIDMVAVLEAWVEDNRPPPDALVQSTREAVPPYAVTRTRPLCRHPGYPHYTGGDPARASSFECRPDDDDRGRR